MIQKLAWASFFERLDAIFFVAPLDCFDEWSDDNENELKHSMDLWGGVVRNEMLGRAPLVLIHNKIDLLREKLEGGTKVADHVVSFKGRPNDVETVIQCKPHSRNPLYTLGLTHLFRFQALLQVDLQILDQLQQSVEEPHFKTSICRVNFIGVATKSRG